MGPRRIPGLLLAALVASSTLMTASPTGAAGGAGTTVLAFGSCGVSRASLALQDGGTGSSGVVVLPDGKVVVGGHGVDGAVTLYRLLPDGTLDATFGTNGGTATRLYEPGAEHPNTALVRDTLVQPDGRIVVTGSSYRRTPTAYHLLFVRYLANGTLDPSFGDGGQVLLPDMGIVEAIGLQADGKLVAATGDTVVRLNPSGALDTTFGDGGIVRGTVPGYVTDLLVQPDGRIVLGFVAVGHEGIGLARLLADGSPDTGFGDPPGPYAGTTLVGAPLHELASIALDPGGRILAAGSGWSGRDDLIVTRHLPEGTLDTTFGVGGIAHAPFPGAVGSVAVDLVVQSDGKPVVATQIYNPPTYELKHDIGLVRLTAGGTPDPTFDTDGFAQAELGVHNAIPSGVAATADGGWVVAGSHDGPVVVRFRGDGPSSIENAALTPQTCSRDATLSGPESFGTQVVHTAGGTRTFTLTATGPRPVAVQRIGFREHSDQFAVRSTTCAGARLAPGASCTVTVAFTPSLPGNHWDALIVWTDTGVGWQATSVYGTVIASPIGWGWNGLGQLGSDAGPQSLVAGAPSGLGRTVALSAGYHHTLALTDEGTVYSWGWQYYNQLGIGCRDFADCRTAQEMRPVAVPNNLKRTTAIAAGGFHSLTLLADGTVMAWGLNSVGQLGIGTTESDLAQHQVVGLTDVVAISAGIYHSLAVKSDGSVWAWGWNHFGQLGDGTTTDRLVPTLVPGLTGVTSVAAGGYHSLALAGPGGPATAWGFNNVGQLGDGSTVDRHLPVAVIGLSDATALAAGRSTAWPSLPPASSSWGWNAFGQLRRRHRGEPVVPLARGPGHRRRGRPRPHRGPPGRQDGHRLGLERPRSARRRDDHQPHVTGAGHRHAGRHPRHRRRRPQPGRVALLSRAWTGGS